MTTISVVVVVVAAVVVVVLNDIAIITMRVIVITIVAIPQPSSHPLQYPSQKRLKPPSGSPSRMVNPKYSLNHGTYLKLQGASYHDLP